MRQRGVSTSRAGRAARGGRRQQNGTYRAEVTRNGITYVTIYKMENGKKIILSTWRK